MALVVKNPPANAGGTRDPGSIPGSGRSSGEGNSSPPQYSCLENPMDRRAWSATIPGVSKSRTRLSNFTFLSLWVLKFDTGITAPGQTDQNTCYSGRKNWAGFTQLHSIPIEWTVGREQDLASSYQRTQSLGFNFPVTQNNKACWDTMGWKRPFGEHRLFLPIWGF